MVEQESQITEPANNLHNGLKNKNTFEKCLFTKGSSFGYGTRDIAYVRG